MHSWDLSALFVHSRQLIDLSVKERCPGRVANSRSPKCDASDGRPRRELEPDEKRVELRQRVSKPVSDLCLAGVIKCNLHSVNTG